MPIIRDNHRVRQFQTNQAREAVPISHELPPSKGGPGKQLKQCKQTLEAGWWVLDNLSWILEDNLRLSRIVRRPGDWRGVLWYNQYVSNSGGFRMIQETGQYTHLAKPLKENALLHNSSYSCILLYRRPVRGIHFWMK